MELLVCFVFVLKHLSFAALLHWWQTTGVNSAFLDLVAICLKTFEYVGRARILEVSPAGPQHKLKMLGEAYVSAAPSALDLHRAASMSFAEHGGKHAQFAFSQWRWC